MPRSLTKFLIEILAMGVIVGILFLFSMFFFQSPCADYAPKELVINCFKADDIWEPFCASPDGTLLATAGFRKINWIANWDDKNRVELNEQDLTFGSITEAIAFSGDGRRVAFYVKDQGTKPTTDKIAIFDAHTRNQITKWQPPSNDYTTKILLSHNGSILISKFSGVTAESEVRRVTLWRTSTGQQLGSLKVPEGAWLGDFSFSQGRIVLAFEQDEHKVISIHESQEPYAHTNLVCSIKSPVNRAFNRASLSADGSLIAAVANLTIFVYQARDGQLVAQFDGNGSTSSASFPGFVFSQDSRLIAISNLLSSDPSIDTVTVWSIRSARKLCTLRGFRSGPCPFSFGPDSKTLITMDWHTFAVWDISGFVNNAD